MPSKTQQAPQAQSPFAAAEQRFRAIPRKYYLYVDNRPVGEYDRREDVEQALVEHRLTFQHLTPRRPETNLNRRFQEFSSGRVKVLEERAPDQPLH